MEPLDIGVIVGSLRQASYNRKVFDNSHALTPEGLVLREIPIRSLPLFDQDVQLDPTEPVIEYWDAVRKADGILFISPEYNYSVPGVVKNAFDWASRPPDSAPIANKPAGVLGASSGRSGTMRMQLHMRQVLPTMNMPVMPQPEVFIMRVADVIDGNGDLHDERVRKQLTRFYAAFEKWVRLFAQRDS
ncbi:MAG TPA: NADPH-dependent FMN reductase [Thermomicrobiales bacterium]|nr:NADPH-dependent FMN reductase [Thermomicrobiales bacterium]